MNVFNLDIWKNYKHSGTMYLYEIYDFIKEGIYKNEVEEIRLFLKKGMKKEAYELKRKLPAFTISGIFDTNRREENIIKYYGLVVLDIDNLKTEEEVKKIKEEICKIEYTKMAFVSPSGMGVKVIVENNNTDVEKHKKVYQEVVDYYKQKLNVEFDEKTVDVVRLCYISYDEDIYLNLESKIFISENTDINKKRNIIKEKVVNEETIFTIEESFVLIEKEVIKFTNHCQKYEKGSRNNYIYLLAKNSKGAGIIKEVTVEYCLNHFVEEDFAEDEIQNIVKSAYNDNKVKFGQWKLKNKNLLKNHLRQRKI